MNSYGKLAVVIVGAWFALVFSASAEKVFRNESSSVGLAVGMAAGAPVLAFAASLLASEKFRRFVLSFNPRTLTLVQSWRVFGLVFVALYVRGILPGIFALPAGYGDFFIGATAPLVAWKLTTSRHRRSFIIWHLLGAADLIMAVTLGTTARLLSSGGASMVAMTVLPLSLVPTFIVPLLLMLHIICIVQATRWEAAQPTGRVQQRQTAM